MRRSQDGQRLLWNGNNNVAAGDISRTSCCTASARNFREGRARWLGLENTAPPRVLGMLFSHMLWFALTICCGPSIQCWSPIGLLSKAIEWFSLSWRLAQLPRLLRRAERWISGYVPGLSSEIVAARGVTTVRWTQASWGRFIRQKRKGNENRSFQWEREYPAAGRHIRQVRQRCLGFDGERATFSVTPTDRSVRRSTTLSSPLPRDMYITPSCVRQDHLKHL
ncbi:hypothetical protein OH76DRAFT_144501 [Lentinus brumalis]|uniref:Uncharacterized protein n=1 Tax=Lentinus brumalis TaxID=2498619 RepID=A0A371CP81_9APHY|nr:hypothetical protein OH76DRAFT_144501 [Polyporus brumalis]